MDDVFCQALSKGDIDAARARLEQVISTTEAMQTDQDPNFSNAISNLVNWLIQRGCVRRVSVLEGVLKTQPPQKVLLLEISSAGKDIILHLKLRLSSRMVIHALEA
jgi:hypothetical protein